MNGEVRFAEMFAGIGGFRLGLEQANSSQQTAFSTDYLRPEGNQSNGEMGTQRCSADNRPIQQDDSERPESNDGFENELGEWKPPRSNRTEGADGSVVHPRSDFAGQEAALHGQTPKAQEGDDAPADGEHKVFRCVWANELDKYAAAIYRENFGTAELVEADIRTVKAQDLPDFDLLVAGFPCQSFSLAGKRRGFEDERGTMFFEVARIARAKKPKVLLLENVKGLLSAQAGYCFWRILQTLDELGYDVQWIVLNSKNHGVPQNRERVFIIGYSRDFCSRQVFPVGDSGELAFDEGKRKIKLYHNSPAEIQRIYEVDGLSPCLHGKTGGWQEPKIAYAIDANYWKGTSLKHYQEKRCRQLVAQSLQTDGFLRQGSSWNNDEPQSARNIRRLTPVECERLQGFPDGFSEKGLTADGKEIGISDTQRYKVLGNAVTTNVVRFLGERILECNQSNDVIRYNEKMKKYGG